MDLPSLVAVLSVFAAGVIYPLELDKRLPQLTLLQAGLLLLIARAIDFATFLIATGGKAAANEINPVYQLLLGIASHEGAAVLSQLVGLLLIGVTLACFWKGGSKRAVLSWLASFAVLSFVGAFFNVIGGIPV